ncbi:MAG: hypothetical protein ACYTXA_20455 [Nostoc sp.]
MSRLIVSLPPFIGTSGSDLVVGKEDNTLLPAIPAIGIEVLKNGVIDTQAGNDTILGTGTGGGDFDNAGTGTGIANSGIINAGMGDDTILGTGTGGFEYRQHLHGTGISNTQGGYYEIDDDLNQVTIILIEYRSRVYE